MTLVEGRGEAREIQNLLGKEDGSLDEGASLVIFLSFLEAARQRGLSPTGAMLCEWCQTLKGEGMILPWFVGTPQEFSFSADLGQVLQDLREAEMVTVSEDGEVLGLTERGSDWFQEYLLELKKEVGDKLVKLASGLIARSHPRNISEAFQSLWVAKEGEEAMPAKLLVALEAAFREEISVDTGNIYEFGRSCAMLGYFFRPFPHQLYSEPMWRDLVGLVDRGFVREQSENGIIRIVPTPEGTKWLESHFREAVHYERFMTLAKKVVSGFQART